MRHLNSQGIREVAALVAPRWRVITLGIVLVIVARLSGLVLPTSMKFLVDEVIGQGKRWLLGPVAAAVLIASMVQAAASFACTTLLTRAGHQLVADLRLRLQSHMGRLPLDYFERRRTGVLTTHIMGDVESVRLLVGTGLVDFLGGLISASVGVIVLISISPRLAAVTIACLAGVWCFTRQTLRQFRPLIRERQRINAEITGRLSESISGIRVVKAYAAERQESVTFASGCNKLLNVSLRSGRIHSIMSLSTTASAGLVGATLMFLGAGLALDGALTIGELLTFAVFLALVIAPAAQLPAVAGQMLESLAALERAREVFRHVPEHDEGRPVSSLTQWRGDLTFQDVWFSYGDGPAVLRGVTFRAAQGSMTALVGPSGAGKSTVASLIAGFYSPTRGRIVAGEVDLSEVRLECWRKQLGVVLQETFLFDGTIRENVMFARPDASESEFVHACQTAHVAEFADRFDAGYDTVVGERGVRLSGGQKQRISIARAILADPKILILDEATSSLDSESEALIQEGLRYLIQGRSTFVIAHRLSTIRHADQILVLEQGEILERGSHESLYSRKGRYFELCSRQELAAVSAVVAGSSSSDGALLLR